MFPELKDGSIGVLSPLNEVLLSHAENSILGSSQSSLRSVSNQSFQISLRRQVAHVAFPSRLGEWPGVLFVPLLSMLGEVHMCITLRHVVVGGSYKRLIFGSKNIRSWCLSIFTFSRCSLSSLEAWKTQGCVGCSTRPVSDPRRTSK